MTTVQDTYLGWEQPRHFDSCKRPQWDVAVRRAEGEYRYQGFAEERVKHTCPDEDCAHGNSFTKVTVRIVCASCGAAQLVTGEHTAETGTSTTSAKEIGYGLAPRRVAGLLLWPGEPFLNFGRLNSDEPFDFLVTRAGVQRVTRADVVGVIMQTRGARGGITWSAAADPRDSKYLRGRIDWARRSNEDATLRSVTAAAKWIAARLPPSETGGAW